MHRLQKKHVRFRDIRKFLPSNCLPDEVIVDLDVQTRAHSPPTPVMSRLHWWSSASRVMAGNRDYAPRNLRFCRQLWKNDILRIKIKHFKCVNPSEHFIFVVDPSRQDENQTPCIDRWIRDERREWEHHLFCVRRLKDDSSRWLYRDGPVFEQMQLVADFTNNVGNVALELK